MWIAQHTAPRIPVNSVVHLGILNSLRAWNFFPFPDGVESNCNVGGFGIDGILSTVVGAAIARPEKIFFAVVGDLAFFYDLNSLGNRHRPENLRILLINNGRGTEFTNFNHPCTILAKPQFLIWRQAAILAASHQNWSCTLLPISDIHI